MWYKLVQIFFPTVTTAEEDNILQHFSDCEGLHKLNIYLRFTQEDITTQLLFFFFFLNIQIRKYQYEISFEV